MSRSEAEEVRDFLIIILLVIGALIFLALIAWAAVRTWHWLT